MKEPWKVDSGQWAVGSNELCSAGFTSHFPPPTVDYMTFTNVKLIVAREIRDQLRDRRTLFVIVVLPILLYPLLGMSFFQVSQFLREQSVRVLVVGAEDLGDLPPLFEKHRLEFAANLFADPKKAKLLVVETNSDEPRPDPRRRHARRNPRTPSRTRFGGTVLPIDFALR